MITQEQAEADLAFFVASDNACKSWGWPAVDGNGVAYRDLAQAAMMVLREEELCQAQGLADAIDAVLRDAQRRSAIARLKQQVA